MGTAAAAGRLGDVGAGDVLEPGDLKRIEDSGHVKIHGNRGQGLCRNDAQIRGLTTELPPGNAC